MRRAKKTTQTQDSLTALSKLGDDGHMAFYKGYIERGKDRSNHTGVIRAFRDTARSIAGSDILPTTVGIFVPAEIKVGSVGFEFCVTADISKAQGRRILAEVKKKTKASLVIQ